MPTRTTVLAGEVVVPGSAAGPLLFADVGISFMGGIDPATGVVVDTHHPLRGRSVAGTIMAIPGGRGSCAGSLTLFELLMNGHAPRALVFRRPEAILALGDIISLALFERGIPIVRLPGNAYDALADVPCARVDGASVIVPAGAEVASAVSGIAVPAAWDAAPVAALPPLDLAAFDLSDLDRRLLDGDFGPAAEAAMRIVAHAARLEGATEFVDVQQAHIDGCFYEGPGTLQFTRRLLELGARVRVPSTMNALTIDRRRWRGQGVAPAAGEPADALADSYVEMGVRPTYTCAPYLLEGAPVFGRQVAWGESNAVAFANSLLGAHTLKYPDYLDILVAVTGRAPLAGPHVDEGRRATIRIDVPKPRDPDDAYFALLGYLVGTIAPGEIPVVCGLEEVPVSRDDLKGFSAAFATTSAAPMFHILSVTPEAATLAHATGPDGPQRSVAVTPGELEAAWRSMTTATFPEVDLVSLGNPHFSPTEIVALARLVDGRRIADGVSLIVTCGREVFERVEAAGHVATIRTFGGEFVTDTCWCLIREPVIPPGTRAIATNSGKYAHYGPGAVAQAFHFASLARCVEAACSGRIDMTPPGWLGASA
ncbi:MAG: cis-3-hydroxy-L-proline dehydratase [Solirubrobacteraceae bacterium]